MRDLLVCYLLGELPEAERKALETQLADDPQLRRELERLRHCFSPDGASPSAGAGPPQGLLDRTVQRCISDSQVGVDANAAVEPAAGRCCFSLVDAIVAVGVVLAISMLMLPALRESRDISRRTVCQDNMRQIGVALISYSQDNQGLFPNVAVNQQAGVFASRLADSDHVDRTVLAHLLVCPSSLTAEALKNGNVVLHIPSLAQNARCDRMLTPQIRLIAPDSFAYRVGYFDGHIYVAIRNQSDCRSPLLSDAPSRDQLADSSPHHGGCGQNVLFEDGHVGYVVGHLLPAWDNHLFLNNAGQHAAGRAWNDAVMLRSEATPGVRAIPVDHP